LCVFSPFRTSPEQPPSPPPASSGWIRALPTQGRPAGVFPAGENPGLAISPLRQPGDTDFSLSPSAPDHLSPDYPLINRETGMAKIHVPDNENFLFTHDVCGHFRYRCKR
jgi:hypothetical protein